MSCPAAQHRSGLQQLALPWPQRSLHPNPKNPKSLPVLQARHGHTQNLSIPDGTLGIFPLPSSPQQTKCNTNRSEFAGANVDIGVCFYTSCWSVVVASSRLIPAHPGAGTELKPLPGGGTEQTQTPRAKPASPCSAAVPSPAQPAALLSAIAAPRRLQPKESSLQDRNLPFKPGNLLWQSCRSQN